MSGQDSTPSPDQRNEQVPRELLTQWILSTTEAEHARRLIPNEKEIGDFCASDPQLSQQMESHALGAEQVARELFRKEWLKATLEVASGDVVPPSEQDVRRYYDSHPERWLRKESRRLRHILITVQDGFEENTEELALARLTSVRAQLISGDDFVQLAIKNSECPTALQEGEMGWVTRDDLFEELSEAAFALEVGVVSAPLRSRLGWHLIECLEAKPEGYEPFDDIAEKLSAALLKRRKLNKQKIWVERLAREKRHAS